MPKLCAALIFCSCLWAGTSSLVEVKHFQINNKQLTKYHDTTVWRYQLKHDSWLSETEKFNFQGSVYAYSGLNGDSDLDSLKELGKLEACYLEKNINNHTVKIGRQVVSLGYSNYFSPFNNIFQQKNILDPWFELDGQNALRYSYYFNELASFTYIGARTDQYQHATNVALFKNNFDKTEVQFVALNQYEREEQAYGWMVKGEVLVGWWLETKHTFNRDNYRSTETVYGIDYTFDVAQGLYCALEKIEKSLEDDGLWSWHTKLTLSEELAYNILEVYSQDDSYLVNTYVDYTFSDFWKFILGTTSTNGAKAGTFSPKKGNSYYGYVQYDF